MAFSTLSDKVTSPAKSRVTGSEFCAWRRLNPVKTISVRMRRLRIDSLIFHVTKSSWEKQPDHSLQFLLISLAAFMSLWLKSKREHEGTTITEDWFFAYERIGHYVCSKERPT